MKKQPDIYFQHMLNSIKQIEKYIKGYTANSFKGDEKTVDAVIRQLEILGKAAGKIPKNLTKDSPIPWNYIVGIRNKLIHEYMGVDINIVWKTASEGLKELKKYLKWKI